MCSYNILINHLFKSSTRLLACLALMFAWPAYSDDNIDFLSCPTEKAIKIPVGVAVAPSSIVIGTDNDPGDTLSWVFDAAPNGSGGVSCSGSGNSRTCSGITITLPDDGPGTSVDISGTATVSGQVTVDFEVTNDDPTDGNPPVSCLGFFTLVYTPGFQLNLVLDRSGSMNSATNVTPPATSRWDALETSINDMSTLIVDEGIVTASDDSTVLQASEIGVSLFDTTYVVNTPPFPDTLIPITNTLPTELATLLNLTPGGATSIGEGLENAFSRLTSVTASKVVLLSTDGEQNRATFVDENGQFLNETATTGCVAAGGDCIAIPADIKIVTLGIMQPSSSYLLTLQNLANESGGVSIITSNGASLDVGGMIENVEDTFTASVVPILRGNSPQLVAFNRAELKGTDSVSLPTFKLNRRLGGMMFRVSFDRKFEIPELNNILAGLKIEKDGVDITTYFKPEFVGNYVSSFYLLSDFEGGGECEDGPDLNSGGSYSFSLTKSKEIRDFSFKVATFADDHLLDIDYGFAPKSPKVMEDLKLDVSLNWRGKPLDTANVKATILKPGDDLGDLLARFGKSVDPGSSPDAGTPGYQKYLNLIENDPDFLSKLLPAEQQLTLSSLGNGAYQSTYNPGDISGIYQVLYNISDDSSDTGTIQRLLVQSIYVRFGDFDESASDVNTTVQGNTTTITFKPISTVGKLIGPGQQNAFSFKGTDIKVTNITDEQNGSYIYELRANPEQEVVISVLGEPVYKGELGKFGRDKKKDEDYPVWLIWGLLALLILILIIWLRRKA